VTTRHQPETEVERVNVIDQLAAEHSRSLRVRKVQAIFPALQITAVERKVKYF